MRKVGRKNLAALGTMFTAAAVLLLAAAAWAFLDRHGYFCPPIRRARCQANLEAIRAAKLELRRELQPGDAEAVSPESLAPLLPKGYGNLACPSGGAYDVGAAGAEPRCSFPGHGEDGVTNPAAARP